MRATQRLGEELYDLRQRHGLTVRKAAVLIGISHSALDRIENGRHSNCRGETFVKILAWAARMGYTNFAGFELRAEQKPEELC